MKQISKGGGPTKIRERLKDEFRSKYGDLDDADLQGYNNNNNYNYNNNSSNNNNNNSNTVKLKTKQKIFLFFLKKFFFF